MADEVIATVEAPAAPAGPSLADRVNALTGTARDHWKATGDLDAAETVGGKKPDVTADPSPADDDLEPETPAETGAVKTEPESGPGNTEQSKSPRTSFRELREGKARAEAERDLLKQQLAESRKSLPAKEEPKPAAIESTRPDLPNLEDFETIKDYNEAVKKWKIADEKWLDAKLESRERQRGEQQQFKSAADKWESIKTQGKSEFKDFEAVAFNAKVPASLAGIVELQSREDGHKLMYHLGKNPDVAAKLAEATDIPGYANYADLMAAARKNPDLAMLVGEKRGIAKAEIARIAESLTKKTTPLKETIAHQPKPSGEVAIEPKGSAIEDELGDVIKRASKGDKQAAQRYKEIMNKRDLARVGA